MKIKFEGKMPLEKLIPNLNKVLDKIVDNVELPKDNTILIENLECLLNLNTPDGSFYATVPREVGGEVVTELLTIAVALDDKGEIKDTVDNEEESFYDAGTLARVLGKKHEYSVIESGYADKDLEVVDEKTVGKDDEEVTSIVYKIKNSDNSLVRYYKGSDLVSETEMLPEFLNEYLSKKK